MFDEAAAKCDVKTVKVKSSVDGHIFDVIITRPHSLKNESAAPGYIWAHGGGAIMFDAEYTNVLCLVTAIHLNCVVFSVDFRNGPEFKAPKGQQDFVDGI